MPPAKVCQLLAGPAAWLAQAMLALMAMAALMYKRYVKLVKTSLPAKSFQRLIPRSRSLAAFSGPQHIANFLSKKADNLLPCAFRHRERPQRPFEVWGYDVSKQVLSMLVAHTCGILISCWNVSLLLIVNAAPHCQCCSSLHKVPFAAGQPICHLQGHMLIVIHHVNTLISFSPIFSHIYSLCGLTA